MLTILLILFVAYVTIVLDNIVLDVYYGSFYDVTYYLTQPWTTVKRASTVVARKAKSVYWYVRIGAESLWNKLAD